MTTTPTSPPAPEANRADSTQSHAPQGAGLALVVGAIGVVFGDIGTSPLYTLKEAFSPHYGLGNDHDTVLGVLSLAFWALNIVVTLKYVTVIMRADNNGEGGILALMALSLRTANTNSKRMSLLMMLGVFGACMFYGDAEIGRASCRERVSSPV